MLSVKNLLFLAVAVTGSVIKRDAALVKADLQTINTDTAKVTTAVNNYNGGVLNALPIINAQQQVTKDIKKATTDAQNAGVVSEADALDIIAYITGTLEPTIVGSLSALKSKKAKFDADGLTGTVKSSLTSLKSDTDALGAALIAGTPANLVAQAQAIQAKIDADFDDAIAFFS
ncbi:hydrophobic surface binding protein [Pochonia chlamydosporia 170]|uniref:Hydrophobic surface binding protein n=1 Tax=Pochonia chlamydosporia 170 TaxID=1380566 RepID=A0A179F541_METCM|nr:hydrophobic surface binding protein [Pochonia chlamydosporia 170]OAQ60522.1 hydrophobic surface binding protein [Pochonia chlamydosporia 170]